MNLANNWQDYRNLIEAAFESRKTITPESAGNRR